MPRRLRSRRTRWSLLVQFGAGSLVPLLVLGIVLANRERDMIRSQQEASAVQFAEVAARGLFSLVLSPSDVDQPLPAARIAALDTIVSKLSSGGAPPHVEFVSGDGTIRYSTEHALIGTRHAADRAFQQALGGKTNAAHLSARYPGLADAQDVLRVDIPSSVSVSGTSSGVVQIDLSYNPIAFDIAHRFEDSAVPIALGLGALWLVLMPLVVSVARRLERQVAENQFLAMHDNLTRLPNRVLLEDRVDRAIVSARRKGVDVAVMLLDLDRFKEVNDSLGHHQGDVLLEAVAARLLDGVRDVDTVARLGGDEFVIMVGELPDGESAHDVAVRVDELFHEAFVMGDVRLDVEASIGVAVFPDDGDTFEELLQRADIAMYAAKATHAGPTLYSAALDVHTPARLAMHGQLRTAVEQDELFLQFQPKLDLRTDSVVGFEALVRWQHPDRGVVGPDEFIPLAERTGLIRPLTAWVLDRATRTAQTWADAGAPIPIAVNVSARSLLDPRFVATVADALGRCSLTPDLLEIEITETAIMADPVGAAEVLTELASLGVRLSIDDFGVGYTSLSHLKRLPVHELKIDRSFVANMHRDENDAVIVRSTVDLGRNLGLQVVAEGVESETVAAQLRGIGCDRAQGFHYAQPMNDQDALEWMRAWNRAPSGST